MAERFAQRLERDLGALNEGLSRPRTQKDPDKIWQRIGRLREKSRGVGQHYDIAVATDESGERAVAVTFRRKPVAGTMLTHPGVYCLRSNETDWSEERLWRTFTLLTDVEAVFRSLKSELGLRPHPSPQAAPCRGPSVHHGDRLPTGPGDSHPSGRARRRAHPHGELDDAQADSRRPSAGDCDVQARRRTHAACTQGDAPGTAAEGHPRCLGNRLLSRGDTPGGGLRGNHRAGHECSAIRAIRST